MTLFYKSISSPLKCQLPCCYCSGMSLDLTAHIFEIFGICPEALTLGVMHLQCKLNFPLKMKTKPQVGGSENGLKRWVCLSPTHEFVSMRLLVVIWESSCLVKQELSSAKAEYLSLLHPNWRQILTFLGGVGESLIALQSLAHPKMHHDIREWGSEKLHFWFVYSKDLKVVTTQSRNTLKTNLLCQVAHAGESSAWITNTAQRPPFLPLVSSVKAINIVSSFHCFAVLWVSGTQRFGTWWRWRNVGRRDVSRIFAIGFSVAELSA